MRGFTDNKDLTFVDKMRGAGVFEGMQVKEVLSKNVSNKHTDIIVFENTITHIARDLIIYDGTFYYTDIYNGLIPYDRDNTQFVFPVY